MGTIKTKGNAMLTNRDEIKYGRLKKILIYSFFLV